MYVINAHKLVHLVPEHKLIARDVFKVIIWIPPLVQNVLSNVLLAKNRVLVLFV